MTKQKIYISSTFKDLKEYRQTLINLFQNQLKNHFELSEIMEKMFDDGTYTPFVKDCIEAVSKSDIYIIILGNKVGSFPPNETRTYTEIELDTALNIPKMKVFFLKLTNFDKNEIDNLDKHNEIIGKFEGRPCHSFSNMLEFQNAFMLNLYQFFPVNKDKTDYNKIFFCDRKQESQSYEYGLRQNDVIQFHLITCHERDMPELFIDRIKLEYQESDTNIIDFFVNPAISPEDNYEQLEQSLKSSIKLQWNNNSLLKSFKLKPFEEVEIHKTIDVLTKLNYDFFIITWQIKSFYWKNERLKEFISSFYEKYAELNATLQTDKKIFLTGVISYVDDSGMTREEFDSKIRDLRFGRDERKIQLKKVNINHIKEWMSDFEIEENPDEQKAIIVRNNLNHQEDYFMSEVHNTLKLIIDKI